MKDDCVCEFKDGKQVNCCELHNRRHQRLPVFPDTPANFKEWVTRSLANQEDGNAEAIVRQVAVHDKELAALMEANVKTYRACSAHMRAKLEGK